METVHRLKSPVSLVGPKERCSYFVRVSGSDESHGLNSSAQHPRAHVHRVGRDTGEETPDGLHAAWVTRVPQRFQSEDHVCLIAFIQTLLGHVN